MPKHLIVLDRPADFRWPELGYTLVSSRDYVARPESLPSGHDRVVNLSRGYDYLSLGYYVSLMAEARGRKVLPAVDTLLALGRKSLYGMRLAELEEPLRKAARGAGFGEAPFSLRIFFGRTGDPRLADLAHRAFALYRAPLLCLHVTPAGGQPRVNRVELLTLADVTAADEPVFLEALQAYTRGRWRSPRPRPQNRYDLAILHDPAEALPPSNRRALAKFVEVGERLGIGVELLRRGDMDRLNEFDALFIRETTAIDNHTFRFALRAQSEGLVVIDDPLSIQRCTNKVYLAELLAANQVPTPRTVILHKGAMEGIEARIGYPAVLKVPDGAFSRGVFKAGNEAELRAIAEKLFKDSSVILAQAFTPSAFDWRIGVLGREPLYACQYFMSRNHWQIIKYGAGGRFSEGDAKTFPISEVAPAVVETAVRAAGLIGDGLYGVDLKQTEAGPLVIEVNDNPNLDAGVEDKVLKDALYRRILEEFVRRIESRRQGRPPRVLAGQALAG